MCVGTKNTVLLQTAKATRYNLDNSHHKITAGIPMSAVFIITSNNGYATMARGTQSTIPGKSHTPCYLTTTVSARVV